MGVQSLFWSFKIRNIRLFAGSLKCYSLSRPGVFVGVKINRQDMFEHLEPLSSKSNDKDPSLLYGIGSL